MERTSLTELKQTIIDELTECNDVALICQIGEQLGLELKVKIVIDVPSQDVEYEVAQ